MHYPGLEEFKNLADGHEIVPVWREISADLDTPVSALYKLLPMDYCFLLESVEGGEHLARYSFLGGDPEKVLIFKAPELFLMEDNKTIPLGEIDPLHAAKDLLFRQCASIPGLPYFTGGAIGYLGFDMAKQFERLATNTVDDLNLPEMVLMFCRSLVVFDHLKHKIKVVYNADTMGQDFNAAYENAVARIDELVERLKGSLPAKSREFDLVSTTRDYELKSNIEPAQYESMVEKAKEYIYAGDIFQVVLAQRFEAEINEDPLMVYRRLRTINPSPYMGFLKFDDFFFIASSPELLVKVQDGEVAVRPIAGTRMRGRDAAEDLALEQELLSDAKEKAEHIMLVDLGRNDIGRVCELGSVFVKDLMTIEKYSHVMHMVSSVCGRLAEGLDCFDVLKSAFPAGTVSGAPKIRAMEIIDELEPTTRGPYAGIFGYFGYDGNMDTGITIRTIIVNGKQAFVGAGAGIVADSVPSLEYMETVNKAKALLTAVEGGKEER